jgi:hypothetical protein
MNEDAVTLAAEASTEAHSYVTETLGTSGGRKLARLTAIGIESQVTVEKTAKGTRIRAHHVWLQPAQVATFAAMIEEAGRIAVSWERDED